MKFKSTITLTADEIAHIIREYLLAKNMPSVESIGSVRFEIGTYHTHPMDEHGIDVLKSATIDVELDVK